MFTAAVIVGNPKPQSRTRDAAEHRQHRECLRRQGDGRHQTPGACGKARTGRMGLMVLMGRMGCIGRTWGA